MRRMINGGSMPAIKSGLLITNDTLRRNEDDRSGGVPKEFVAISSAVLHN